MRYCVLALRVLAGWHLPACRATKTLGHSRLSELAELTAPVRARIAALRAAKAKQPTTLADPSQADPFAPSSAAPSPVESDFGLQSIGSAIDKARKTGKLNISSRSLAAIPADVWADLAPRSSPLHPCHRAPPPSHTSFAAASKVTTIDLSISHADEDDGGGWIGGAAVDLVTFAAAANELDELDEAIGALAALEKLDVR